MQAQLLIVLRNRHRAYYWTMIYANFSVLLSVYPLSVCPGIRITGEAKGIEAGESRALVSIGASVGGPASAEEGLELAILGNRAVLTDPFALPNVPSTPFSQPVSTSSLVPPSFQDNVAQDHH